MYQIIKVGYTGSSCFTSARLYAPIIGGIMLDIRKAYKGEHAIFLPDNQSQAMLDWCEQTFGTPGRSKNHKWRRSYVRTNKFLFQQRIFLRSESDVTMFRLRWE